MNILKILTDKRKKGNLGERAAAKYLKKKGYKILARNFVALDKEIDIIARTGDLTVFVEVKTRTVGNITQKEARPASSVTPEKQRGILIAAKSYLTQNMIKSRSRLDVIEVYLEGEGRTRIKEIKHLEGAFNANTAYKRR